MYYNDDELETAYNERTYKYSWETKTQRTETPDEWERYTKNPMHYLNSKQKCAYMRAFKK